MSVDAERFFPRVLYGLPGNPGEQQSWNLAKAAGFNTITMFFPTQEAFLYADAAELKTVVRLDYAFPDFEPNENELRRLHQEPSVIAWEIDEPYPTWPNLESRLKFLSWLSERSSLPLRVTTYSGARLVSSPEGTEFLERLYSSYPNIISGPDAYNPNPEMEIQAYDEYWDQQRRSGRTDIKTLWQVTSAHTEDEVYFGRDLTYEDIYYQTISGIVAGSRGIAYYDSPWGCDLRGCNIPSDQNGIINSFAQNFENLRRVNSHLKEYESALLGTEVYQGTLFHTRIRIFADAYQMHKYWTFVSNPITRQASVHPQLIIIPYFCSGV